MRHPNIQKHLPLTEKERVPYLQTLKKDLLKLKWPRTFASSQDPIITPLQMTSKSQVYTITYPDQSPLILKRFTEKVFYYEEILAYTLFKGCNIPKVFETSAPLSILLLEKLEEQFIITDPQDAFSLIENLACMHGIALYKAPFVEKDLNNHCLKAQCRKKKMLNREDQEMAQKLMACLGENYVPFCLGDQKKIHYFRHHGEPHLIDLETMTFGECEFRDLLDLHQQFEIYLLPISERSLFKKYWAIRKKINADYPSFEKMFKLFNAYKEYAAQFSPFIPIW